MSCSSCTRRGEVSKKLIPKWKASWTKAMVSSSFTFPNTFPREDAPNPKDLTSVQCCPPLSHQYLPLFTHEKVCRSKRQGRLYICINEYKDHALQGMILSCSAPCRQEQTSPKPQSNNPFKTLKKKKITFELTIWEKDLHSKKMQKVEWIPLTSGKSRSVHKEPQCCKF